MDGWGALDQRITSHADVRALRATAHVLRATAHVRDLAGTCWRLGSLPELGHLRLRAFAHTLGYRGQCLSKTCVYSTTFRALRAERTAFRAGRPAVEDVGSAVDSNWRYVGRGYTPGEMLIAAGIAEDLAHSRELAREADHGH